MKPSSLFESAITLTRAVRTHVRRVGASFTTLSELDGQLEARGFRPMTPWWREQAEKYYACNAPVWVARVGRGGTKSTMLVKFALNEALFGKWNVPVGEMHFVPIVSENKDEASLRLLLIQSMLFALGITHKVNGATVAIDSDRIGFKVLAARIGAVSGFRAICRCADEIAKWNDEGTDPSEEILSSLAAMSVSHPNARGFLCSSPMGQLGKHYELVEAGNSSQQFVSVAPTWIANPSISEARTRQLEPNERIWRREYAAIPQGGLLSVFDVESITRAIDNGRGLIVDSQAAEDVMVIDASRGGDAWAYCLARWVWAGGKERLRVTECEETPKAYPGEDFTKASIDWLTKKAQSAGVHVVMADQYEAGSLGVLFRERGFSFWEHPWTVTSKRNAVDRLERWLRDGTLMLPEQPKLRTQLLEYTERIQRGNVAYGGVGPHDDYVQVIMTLAMAEDARRLEHPDPPKTDAPVRGSPAWAKEQEERDIAWIKKQQREQDPYDGVSGFTDDDLDAFYR